MDGIVAAALLFSRGMSEDGGAIVLLGLRRLD